MSIQQDVLGFQIPMKNKLIVDMVKRKEDLAEEVQNSILI